MNEMALVESKNLRDECIHQTDVLHQFGFDFRNTYILSTEVVEIYQITLDTLNQTVRRHRNEFDIDGIKLLSAKDFKNRQDIGFTEPRKIARRGCLAFNAACTLRLGMLLRDSAIAIHVRTAIIEKIEKSDNRLGKLRTEWESKLNELKLELKAELSNLISELKPVLDYLQESNSRLESRMNETHFQLNDSLKKKFNGIDFRLSNLETKDKQTVITYALTRNLTLTVSEVQEIDNIASILHKESYGFEPQKIVTVLNTYPLSILKKAFDRYAKKY